MAKREYIRANKDWLEAKAKEEGVKALPKGIYYKVLSEGKISQVHNLLSGVLSRLTTQGRPLTANSSTAAVAVFLWLADYVTSLKVGLLPCSRCISATNGSCISLQRWAMASSLNQAYQVTQH